MVFNSAFTALQHGLKSAHHGEAEHGSACCLKTLKNQDHVKKISFWLSLLGQSHAKGKQTELLLISGRKLVCTHNSGLFSEVIFLEILKSSLLMNYIEFIPLFFFHRETRGDKV